MGRKPRSIEPSAIEQPPEPPEIARAVRMPPSHAIGVAMLSMIVLLAALGTFGESRGSASGAGAAVEMSVEYPTRFRYKQINPMQVLVTNRSAAIIDTLTVSFDTAYIARFSTVVLTPSPSRAWEVELIGLRPGETRRIHVQLQGERYGRHRGTVAAFFAGSDTARAAVSTYVFP